MTNLCETYRFMLQDSHDTVVPRLLIGTHSLGDFLSYFDKGTPVIVSNAVQYLQGYWTPEEFIDRHGQEKVTLTNCENNRQRSSTVREYFQSLLEPRASDRDGIWKLKVSKLILCLNAGVDLIRTDRRQRLSKRASLIYLSTLR